MLHVALHAAELERQFLSKGVRTVFQTDGEPALWMRPRASRGSVFGVNRVLFARLFYEFQSLAWFVEAYSIEALEFAKGDDAPADTVGSPGEGWYGPLSENMVKVVELFDAQDALEKERRLT